jgi:uncharacterized membrane protein YfhO
MDIIQKIRPGYIILVFVLIFFSKELLGPVDGNFIGGIDVVEYFFWNAHFIKEQFLSGNIPLWNPYYYCGHPFLANPQTFIFYPSTFFYIVFSPSWAFNLDTILHVYLAAMGAYYFVFLVTQFRSAGLVAGITYGLSGYFMDNIFAGHLTMVHTAALLPWMFYFIEKSYITKRKLFLAVCGLVFGLQILGGEPQNAYYTALFLSAYFFIRYFSVFRPFRFESVYRFGIYFLLIPIIALGVSAIQILPSVEFMSLSDRAENTFEFATFYSFPPRNLFTFLIPKPDIDSSILNANWEFAGYIGIISIFLAGIGVLFSTLRQYTLSFASMLLIALTIMLGHYTPIYHLYYKWLPLLSTFRIPSRCLIILVFSMAVLCGLGVSHLNESQLTGKKNIVIIVGLTLLFICQLGGCIFFKIPLNSKGPLLSLSMTAVSLGIFTLIKFKKNNRIVAVLIITVLFLDLYMNYSGLIPKINMDQLSKRLQHESIFDQDSGFYRVNLPFGRLRGMKFSYYGVNGYTPIALNDFFDFVHYMATIPKLLNRRHTLNPGLFQRDKVFSSKILGVKYAIAKTKLGYKVLTTSKVMPRATLVREAVVLPQLKEHLEHIKRPDFHPEKIVLIESAPEIHKLTGSKMENKSIKDDYVSITNYQPNRITLKSDSETNTFLVLSELFYPGWHAYVDGVEVKILRADYMLRAIPLQPGMHEIIFVYKPMSFFLGAAISGLTFLIFVSVYLVARRKKCGSLICMQLFLSPKRDYRPNSKNYVF